MISNWVPLQNPAGGPYFGKLDPERALLRQDRQHGRRRRGRRLPLGVQEPVPEPELVPVRGPAGQLDQRQEPQLRPDLQPLPRASAQRARSSTRTGSRRACRSRRTTSGRRRCLTTRGRRRGRPRAARRREDVRRPGRRPVLRRPRLDLRRHQHRQARPPGDRARQPGRRQGRRLRLQRPFVRAADPAVRGHARPSGRVRPDRVQRRRRHLDDDRAQGRSRSSAARPRRTGCRSAASATRSSTRSIVPIGAKDQYNATAPKDDLKNFGAGALAPEPARILNALFKLGIKENGPHGHRAGAADRRPRPDADRAERGPGRHAEVQPRRAAVREPEPLRRARRRHRRVPERPPAGRRRRRHRAARDRAARCSSPNRAASRSRSATASTPTTSRSATTFPYVALPDSGFEAKFGRIEPAHAPVPQPPVG